MEQKEKLCDEVETGIQLTYRGDKVSAGGGCEAVLTARTRCGWINLGSVVSCYMKADFH